MNMAATPWELVNDNEIKVTKVDYESFTDESGTHQRAIVQRGRARDIWREGEIIGAGAYGSVSTFTHHKANGKVKIQAVKKVMKAPLSARRVDYRKELDAILKFSGGKYADFFVKAYGWYDNPDCVFIVMEYFEHGDLDAYMKQLGQPLPESEVRRIVSQLAEGLDLVHRSRFVHRDIKPAKGPGWEVKIGDFGFSKRIKVDSSLRSTVGTSLFCAPEVQNIFAPDMTEKSMDNYTEKVDMWSVGATAFYLLFLAYPFPKNGSLDKYVDEGAELQFPSTPKISQHGYDFLKVAMAPNAARRMSVGDALDHPWLKDISLESSMNALSLDTHNGPSAIINQVEKLQMPLKITQSNRENNEAEVEAIEPFVDEGSLDKEERVLEKDGLDGNEGPDLENVEQVDLSITGTEEDSLGWYVNAVQENSITAEEFLYLSNSLISRERVEKFIKMGGATALANTLDTINIINFWALPAFISGMAISAQSVERGRVAISCLVNLIEYPKGLKEVIRNQKVITSLIHALIAWDISTRISATAALFSLLGNSRGGTLSLDTLVSTNGKGEVKSDQELLDQVEAHSAIIQHLEINEPSLFEPRSRTRWYIIWISNVSMTLDNVLASSNYPVDEKITALDYLHLSMALINYLVTESGYRATLRESVIEGLQVAGVNNSRTLFFDRLHKLGTPEIDQQIELSIRIGLLESREFHSDLRR